MDNQILRDRIADYVLGEFEDEVESIEENCGSFWMNLKNGETWFIQVGLCEKEEDDDETG